MFTYLHPQLIPLCVLSGFIYFKNNRHLLHVQSAHFRPPASSLVHPSETTKLALSTEDQTMRQEHPEGLSFKCGGINTIWNRTRPRALVQNQHMRELTEDVPPVEFMPFVFTRVSGESYHWQLRSFLLRLCDIFQMVINSLVGWFYSGINQDTCEEATTKTGKSFQQATVQLKTTEIALEPKAKQKTFNKARKGHFVWDFTQGSHHSNWHFYSCLLRVPGCAKDAWVWHIIYAGRQNVNIVSQPAELVNLKKLQYQRSYCSQRFLKKTFTKKNKNLFHCTLHIIFAVLAHLNNDDIPLQTTALCFFSDA